MDQPIDMWKALDAALLSFDRLAAQLTPLSSSPSTAETSSSGGKHADELAPAEPTGQARGDCVSSGSTVAGGQLRGLYYRRYRSSSAEECASSGGSSCCSGTGSGDEEVLQLSLSSQSSLGYRSASDASDDAPPLVADCRDSSIGSSLRSSAASIAASGSSPSPRELFALGSWPEEVDLSRCLLSNQSRKTCCIAGKRCAGEKHMLPSDFTAAGSTKVIEPHGHTAGVDGHTKTSSVRSTPIRQSLIPRASSAINSVTEEDFERVFRTTRKVEILSSADLETRLLAIEDVLTDSSKSWEQRIDALKGLRQLVLAAGSDSTELGAHLRGLAVGFQLALADVRSQVTREACFTVGYLAYQLGTTLEPFAEIVFHPLINLVLSSTSLIAKAGGLSLLFLFRHVHSQKLLILVIQQMTSKAVQIRRHASELVELAVLGWPTSAVDKCRDTVREACLKNCEDADEHVREVCTRVLGKLSAQLDGGQAFASAGRSSSSVGPEAAGRTSVGKHVNTVRLQSDCSSSRHDHRGPLHGGHSTPTSSEKLAPSGGSWHDHHEKAMDHRSHVKTSNDSSGRCASPAPSAGGQPTKSAPRGLMKAADLVGGKHRVAAQQSLSTASPTPANCTAAPTSSPKSQLASSSGSSNSRGSSTAKAAERDVPTLHAHPCDSVTASAAVRLHGLPSPGRLQSPGRLLSGSSSSTARERHHSARSHDSNDQVSTSTTAASLPSERAKDSGAGTADEDNYYDDDDDFEAAASDLSSVCSETLEIDGHRGGRGGALSGSVAALLLPANADIGEVLANVGSPLWAARRRGLLQLQRFVSEHRSLNVGELKRVAELFTRTFHDPDAKVYSTFLDTLVEVVSVHPHDLSGWLPTLLSKLLLLNPHGGRRLTSITSKVQRALRAVRASFDNTVQFHAVCAILANEGSTMGVQEKLRTLQFLLALLRQMEPSEFSSRHDTEMLTRAFEQLVIAGGEIKSAGVRKMAPEVLVGLFELNAPEFSYVLSRSPGPVQVAVRSALQTYMLTAVTATAAGDASGNGMPPPRLEQSSRTVDPVEAAPKNAGAAVRICGGSGSHGLSAASAMLKPSSPSAERQATVSYSNGWRSARHPRGSDAQDGDRAAACSSSDSGIQGSPTDLGGLSSPTMCPPSVADVVVATAAANGERSSQAAVLPVHDSDVSARETKQALGGTSKSFSNTLRRALPDVVTHVSISNGREEAYGDTRSSSGSSERASTQPPSAGSSESDNVKDETAASIDGLLHMVQDSSNLDYRELCALASYVKDGGIGVLEDLTEPLVLKALRASHSASLEGTAAAEELLDVVVSAANPDHLLAIVCKASQSDDSQLRLAAIRTESKIIQQLTDDVARRHVDNLLLGLVQGFNHTESALRKASVLALVELYAHIGDALIRDHLTKSLNSGQIKLLNVYIERTSVRTKEDGTATTT